MKSQKQQSKVIISDTFFLQVLVLLNVHFHSSPAEFAFLPTDVILKFYFSLLIVTQLNFHTKSLFVFKPYLRNLKTIENQKNPSV